MPRPRLLRTPRAEPANLAERDEAQGADEKKKTFEIPSTLAGGAALVVAALAAVGVSGGTLTRAARNQPIPMAILVSGMVVAVGVPALALLRGSRLYFVSLLTLLVVLVSTVGFGAFSVGQREQPRLELSASTKGQATTISVSASGSGLKSHEDMLVQIQAMTTFPDTSPPAVCAQDRFGKVPKDSKQPDWPGPLLLWQQAGPDAAGVANVKSTLEIPVGDYAGVCALVALRAEPGTFPSIRKFLHIPAPSSYRFVKGYLRMPAPVS